MATEAPRPRHYTKPDGSINFGRVREVAKEWLTRARRRNPSKTVRSEIDAVMVFVRREVERRQSDPMQVAADVVDAAIMALGIRPGEYCFNTRETAIAAVHAGRLAYLSSGRHHNHSAASVANAVNRGSNLVDAVMALNNPRAADPAWRDEFILSFLVPVNAGARVAAPRTPMLMAAE